MMILPKNITDSLKEISQYLESQEITDLRIEITSKGYRAQRFETLREARFQNNRNKYPRRG